MEIIEWIDRKQKGFMTFDVETLEKRILQDVDELIKDEYTWYHGMDSRDVDKSEAVTEALNNIKKQISKRFGIGEIQK